MSGLSVRAVLEDRHVEVDFEVAPGEVVAILGANGAGKSTVLHMIAGLLRPDTGIVSAGRRRLTDTAAGVQVVVHDRHIGLLQQDPMLFPHLDVTANVAFGPRCTGRRNVAGIAEHWLKRVGALDLSRRMPRELSGGQAQRVALARALAAAPDVLLLDEPLAGLDVSAATAMRKVLREVLTADGRCAVLVTHDLLDVTALADRVLVLDEGRIAESGPMASLLAAPSTIFGARFAGLNLMTGSAGESRTLHTGSGDQVLGMTMTEAPTTRGESVIAVFAPSAVRIHRQPTVDTRGQSTFEVTVAELDHRGAVIRVRADPIEDGAVGLAADITAQTAAELRLIPGERVWFSVSADDVAIRRVG